MNLRDAFPLDMQERHVRDNLTPGTVVRFGALMDDGKYQIKRFVVLHSDEKTLTVVINSEINQILRTPALFACQVVLPLHSHGFMIRDSSIDCSRVRTFETADIILQAMNSLDSDWLLGKISPDVRDQMLAALKRSPTIAPPILRVCCEDLEFVDLSPGLEEQP